MKVWRSLVPILVLALAACEGGASGGDVLATAGGADLSAQEAAEILAPQTQLPAQPEVARALADLWIQYYLLARAAVEDSTLSNLDFAPLVERQVNGQLLSQLRESVVQTDTTLSEEELRSRYEASLPGGRIRARHILLRYPEGATETQMDSVRSLAEELRSRLLEGEDFEALAREYSQDEATAAQGGELGSFGKNEMVPAFEAAAFNLQVGEISEVVETPYGLHLIRVDERLVPSFEERRDQFRGQVLNQMAMAAESTFVADLAEGANIQITPDALESIRRLASDPGMEITRRALQRPLAEYDGGSYTLGEFRTWLLTNPQNLPEQIAAGSDEQLENLLSGLTRSELLVNEARSRGFEVSVATTDSIAEGLVSGVRDIARNLGFFSLEMREGETSEEAAQRVVLEILTAIVQEGRNVYPLQTVAFALKEQYGARIYEAGLDRTAELVEEMRSPAQQPVPMGPADTSGNPGGADSAQIDSLPSEGTSPDTSGTQD